ncbi:hypothetical protein [Haliscomenobacter sp.]|uniref:hypothetical protein n=1 Tax=Haliscomenobacter sp. TaxID=2717303 RepID=UPI0033650FB8
MKTLLILTGPQGAGNHLWSKIFALHPQVLGWRALLDTHWIGHDQEPFAQAWQDPARLNEMSWRQADWFVTSMSVPYMNNGTVTVPDFKSFVRGVQNLGHRVIFGVLGRDQNIVRMQQTRVRGAVTLDQSLKEFDNLAAPVFLSYELLHLYGHKYLESIGRQLNFPIAVNDPRITAILADDTNAKYFGVVGAQPTDELARHASRKHT